MSSKTRIAVVSSTSLTIALSLAILGLSARHISFIRNLQLNHRNIIDVTYDVVGTPGQGMVSRTNAIWYLPDNFTMQDINTMQVAGVLSAVLGAAILVLSFLRPDLASHTAITGRKVRSFRFSSLTASIALNGVIVALLAAATGSSWCEYSRHKFFVWVANSLHQDGPYLQYSNPVQHFNFEGWNCMLAPHIRPGLTSLTTPMLQSLCKQAQATRYMSVPTLLLPVLALGLQFWACGKHSNAVREFSEAAPPYDEVIRKETDLESQSQWSGEASMMSPVSRIDAPVRVTEMPEKRMTTEWAELPMNGKAKKMMGDDGHKKMYAGDAAVEKPVNGKA